MGTPQVIDAVVRGKFEQGPHAAPWHSTEFRFYEELNDFLPAQFRKRSFVRRFRGNPAVKDTIEAIGVPHTEVDLVIIDGRSVGFDEQLRGGERVAVYPVFERIDISPLVRLRPAPLRVTRFVVDVHLGKLARHLRLLGFDTLWQNDFDDDTIIALALAERRIILTRDRGILKDGRVTHGYWPRATDPMRQIEEVVRALDLGSLVDPYSRCLECNGVLEEISPTQAGAAVPPQVLLACSDFSRCGACGRTYWPGSHRARLDVVVDRARAAARRSEP
jgi:uncharacterized protein